VRTVTTRENDRASRRTPSPSVAYSEATSGRRGEGRFDPVGDIDTLVEIATRFHIRGDTQERIASEFGVHGSTVSRALRRARAVGIVRIEIVRPPRLADALAEQLAEVFPISRALVVEQDPYDIRALGTSAAALVQSMVVDGMRIGLSWGSSLYHTVRALRVGSVRTIHASQLCGGFPFAMPGTNARDLIEILIGGCQHATAHYLPAPLIVGSASLREALETDATISACLQEARHSDLALVGIGALDDELALVMYGLLTKNEQKRLRAKGVVGETCARFFDLHGREVADEIASRSMGVTLSDLAAIPSVVAIAAGTRKVAAIHGACLTGVVDTLITDAATARGLLQLALQTGEPPRGSPGLGRGRALVGDRG
jgi:DNA-binding transcriptional regulator LsrR (DeoR family)